MRINRRDALRHLLILGGSLASVAATSRIISRTVGGSGSPDAPDGASNSEETLSGTVRLSSITIPTDQVLRFDPDRTTTVEVSGNVVVKGTLRMRPARAGVVHTLRFVGVDESRFQGGGMDVLDTDVGLWVRDRGRLDIAGTPKRGWNRKGDHRTWEDSDEIRVTPTDAGDFAARTFRRGTTVPRGRANLPPAEVFNLTRNVHIEGTPGGRAHIHIMSSVPQRIRHAELRHLGPSGVLGRYPLHFHLCGKGSRQSQVVGVVIRDSGNNGFWPHESDGITFRDCVAYNITANGDEGAASFGWDDETSSHHTRFEHCLAVDQDSSELYRTGMFLLGMGDGNACVGCAGAVFVSKAGGSGGSGVFHWGKKGINAKTGVWRFPPGNVAHNVAGNGLSTWQNDAQVHNVDGFVVYRCLRAGIDHGAYQNGYRYRDGRLVECARYGVFDQADSQEDFQCQFQGLHIEGSEVGFFKARSPNPGEPVLVCRTTWVGNGMDVMVESQAVEPRVRASC